MVAVLPERAVGFKTALFETMPSPQVIFASAQVDASHSQVFKNVFDEGVNRIRAVSHIPVFPFADEDADLRLIFALVHVVYGAVADVLVPVDGFDGENLCVKAVFCSLSHCREDIVRRTHAAANSR